MITGYFVFVICFHFVRVLSTNLDLILLLHQECGGYSAEVPTLWSGGAAALSSASLPTTPLKFGRGTMSPSVDFGHKQGELNILTSFQLA
jgi:hypothetical protein